MFFFFSSPRVPCGGASVCVCACHALASYGECTGGSLACRHALTALTTHASIPPTATGTRSFRTFERVLHNINDDLCGGDGKLLNVPSVKARVMALVGNSLGSTWGNRGFPWITRVCDG